MSYCGKILKNDSEISDLDNDKLLLNIEENSIDFNLNDYLLTTFDDLIFFYKPPFMHTERQRPTDALCISDILHKHFEGFRLISRLDFETDGVIAAVGVDFSPSKIFKKYCAWVHGRIDRVILFDRKIDANKRKKVLVMDEKGDNILKILPIKHSKNYTFVEVDVEIAHRHQIRASLAFLGHPIVGDKLYGKDDFYRLLLQCFYTEIEQYSIDLFDLKPDVAISSLQNFQ